MICMICNAKISKTRWFSLLFSAPVDDLTGLTGLTGTAAISKSNENLCFVCFQYFLQKSLWKHMVFQWFGSMASESEVMNPKQVGENPRFFDVSFARQTFAMGPRMAQALKNQENYMFCMIFYAKIKNTLWFCILFSAPVDDLARLTGLLVDRRNNLKK